MTQAQTHKPNSRWIRHYHIPELNTLIPSITVVVLHDAYDTTENMNRMTVSWAICSPPDNFSRKIGREIATESKNVRGYQFSMPVDCDDHPIDFAIRYLLNSNIPSGDKDVKLFRERMKFYEENEDLITIGRHSRRFSRFYPAFRALKASLFNLKNNLMG